jgi:hypothetical protein
MTRDGLNSEIARQRQAELSRAVARHSVRAEVLASPDAARTRAQDAVTIRLAAADDGTGRLRVSLRAVARLSRSLLPR